MNTETVILIAVAAIFAAGTIASLVGRYRHAFTVAEGFAGLLYRDGKFVERLGVEPGRIRVIHLGVDLDVFTPSTLARGEFLLYPANRWPHKNHERLFAALAILVTRLATRHRR